VAAGLGRDGVTAGLGRDDASVPLAPSAASSLVDVDLPGAGAARFVTPRLVTDREFLARFDPRVISSTLAVVWVAAGRRARLAPVLVALSRIGVLAADDFTDPEHERLIYLAAGGLALLGILLTVVTVLWWRGTKGEHAALAPLEVMGDRSWNKLTHVEQTRRLETVRIHTAGDVEPAQMTADPVDLDEALRSFQPGFDDLRDEPSDTPEEVPEPSVEPSEVGEIDVSDERTDVAEVAAVAEPAVADSRNELVSTDDGAGELDDDVDDANAVLVSGDTVESRADG
jgi:hypothetical protein